MATSRALDASAVEALLSGRPVAGEQSLLEALKVVRTLASAPPPPPGVALAVLLEQGLPSGQVLPPLPRHRAVPRRSWSARAAVVLAAVTVATAGAATANALPAGVQDPLADLVGTLTPFELPRPSQPDPSGDQLRAPGPGSSADPDRPGDGAEREPVAGVPDGADELDQVGNQDVEGDGVGDGGGDQAEDRADEERVQEPTGSGIDPAPEREADAELEQQSSSPSTATTSPPQSDPDADQDAEPDPAAAAGTGAPDAEPVD